MDASRVQRGREEMARAEARRLQPHYIESFFREAFRQLGGSARQREPRRYQVSHVPAPIRNRDRLIGTSEPVLPRYERIVFVGAERFLDCINVEVQPVRRDLRPSQDPGTVRRPQTRGRTGGRALR